MAIFNPPSSVSRALQKVVSANQKQSAINEVVDKFRSEFLTPVKFGTSALLESTVNTITRLPWIITCDSWVSGQDEGKGYPQYIIMRPNPKKVRWSIPFRKSMAKTAGGFVTFSWRDATRGNTVFDEPILELTMQSGSLLPVLDLSGKVKEQIAASASRITPNSPGKSRLEDSLRSKLVQNNFKNSHGLEVFYSFLRLFNVPQLKANGEPNYIRIVMNTMLFPRLVVRGQFVPEENLDWEESAEDPTSIEWTVKFVINKITPNIGIATFKEMLDTWATAGGSSGFRVPPNEDLSGVIEQEVATEEAEFNRRLEKDTATKNAIRQNRSEEMIRRADATETTKDTTEAKNLQEAYVKSAEKVQERGIGVLDISAKDAQTTLQSNELMQSLEGGKINLATGRMEWPG